MAPAPAKKSGSGNPARKCAKKTAWRLADPDPGINIQFVRCFFYQTDPLLNGLKLKMKFVEPKWNKLQAYRHLTGTVPYPIINKIKRWTKYVWIWIFGWWPTHLSKNRVKFISDLDPALDPNHTEKWAPDPNVPDPPHCTKQLQLRTDLLMEPQPWKCCSNSSAVAA